jgi:hypothetical protein
MFLSIKTMNQARFVYSLLFLRGIFSAPVKAFRSALPQFKTRQIQAQSSINEGVAIVVEIVFLAVGLYVAAFVLPSALTAIATSVLTSELFIFLIATRIKQRSCDLVPNTRAYHRYRHFDSFVHRRHP